MAHISAVTAVLGPTNTGKTHLAVERMLAHGSGMIGLPLRLLAREIYDRVRAKAGDHAVALVTGEEKIIPPSPRYWVATVEAMPPDVVVPFLAIDECQLCGDFERGAIFTDRVLHRRGSEETMLLGAATMKPILEALLPRVNFVSRPRLSQLTYSGSKKISRLPRRSAIVAFSADNVYATAELIRRHHGGAAVVMGALSPRTRNAQVELFQSGDVDYIVATDAIGMGLNMAVDHVAFASSRKFDGFQFRDLTPAELAQIAGRAGRYLSHGSFGVTGAAELLDAETVERIESHHFEPVRVLQWRNPHLNFRTLDGLLKSLGQLPKLQGLTRAQAGPDITALEALARDGEVVSLADRPARVELLWSVCQIPDYRNISPSEHAHLVGRIFKDLASPAGFINEDWFARQLRLCDNKDGDLDTLSTRISHVRTWTFVANRGNWLKAPGYWQQSAREIEDKLSDVLHERLTLRFIDRRTSVLMRRLAQKEELMADVQEDGAIRVEGEYVGHIKGLSFVPDGADASDEQRTLKQAAMQAVAAELQARANSAIAAPDTDFKLGRCGDVIWQGSAIAQLEASDQLLAPRITVIADDLLQSPQREELRGRLEKFLTRHIASLLEPLVKLQEAETLQGLARGIAFRMVEMLGVLPRDTVSEDVKALSQEDRAALRGFGLRFGAFHLFIPVLLKPAATELRLLLWGLHGKKFPITALPLPPGQGLTSAVFDRSTPVGFYGVCGYRICGTRVVRIDMLERLADLIRDRVFWRPRFAEEQRPAGSVEGGGFTIVPDMMSLVGCSGDEFQGILRSLNFRMQKKQIPNPALALAVIPTVADPLGDAAQDEASQIDTAAIPGEGTEPLSELAQPTEEEAAQAPPVATDLQLEGNSENDSMAGEVPVAEAVTAEPIPAEIEIEIWWPKDTGPFRHHRPRDEAKPQRAEGRHNRNSSNTTRRSPDGASEGDAAPAGARPKSARPDHRERHKARRNSPETERHERSQRRPEKPMDPDSPFAVLSALKAQMKADSH